VHDHVMRGRKDDSITYHYRDGSDSIVKCVLLQGISYCGRETFPRRFYKWYIVVVRLFGWSLRKIDLGSKAHKVTHALLKVKLIYTSCIYG